MSKAHFTTLTLGSLQQWAHATHRISNDQGSL